MAEAEASVRTSLRRIAARDGDVRAWTHVGASQAIADARALDARAGPAPLAGHVLAVKDVIDVSGMPTGHNSPLGQSRPALADAPCVALLRQAGAVILGKTDTTEFACAGRNAATANPHAFSRTPGGSSSGSAAAVADGHVSMALATQTGGSTIRPASFCGIPALKPSWGLISREGVKMYANSLDTVGLYARSFADIDLLCGVYGFAPAEPRGGEVRLGLCQTPYWHQADEETRLALSAAGKALRATGARVDMIDLPPSFDRLERAFRVILFREGAAAFLDLARTHPDLLHADFHERVASIDHYGDAELREAYDLVAEGRREMERLMASYDGVLTPSGPGIAPLGRGPGNPIFNQLWTLLHVPTVNLPLFAAQDKMPLGLSLVGPRFSDRWLIGLAEEVTARVREGFAEKGDRLVLWDLAKRLNPVPAPAG